MESRAFHLETYGCSANKADSEIMAGLLEQHGYRSTGLEEAEYVIVNTCAVKQPTEDRVVYRLEQLSRLGKKLVVAGCLPKVNPGRMERAAPGFAAAIDPKSIHRLPELLDNVAKGSTRLAAFDQKPSKMGLPRRPFNRLIGIVPVAEGCSFNCAFCATKLARGDLFSYPSTELVEEARRLIEGGCVELWLTGQDVGGYRDGDVQLPELLERIAGLDGRFMVRVGMMNPVHASRNLERLIEAYGDPKDFKFLHLPVQSGSKRILRLMKRGYAPETPLGVVKRFRKVSPELTLSTDIIVGFPTETDRDFQETVDWVREAEPDIVNISKFGPRPGTEAARMPQLPRSVVNERSVEMAVLVREIAIRRNRRWIGRRGEALVDEEGVKEGTWVARNPAYKPVVIRWESRDLLGRFVEVEIEEATPTYLVGKLV